MTTTINLTELESKVLKAINDSDYGNEFGDPIWMWDVSDNANVRGKAFSGVVSSLTQKGLVGSQVYNSDEDIIWVTELGKEVCLTNNLAGPFQK